VRAVRGHIDVQTAAIPSAGRRFDKHAFRLDETVTPNAIDLIESGEKEPVKGMFPLAIMLIFGPVVLGSMRIHGWTGWRSGSEDSDFWQQTPDGYFMEHRRSKWARGSQKKLCFVARSQGLLAETLEELAARPDCLYVKYSTYQKDGMYLGRCFLKDDDQVGLVWAEFKNYPRLFCSVQDDDFVSQFR
jgi:hypothetical protein